MTTNRELFYQRLGRPLGKLSLSRRRQDALHDYKWRLFLRYSSLLRHLPFIDFVFGSGSLALGNVKPDSDFDVLIGARAGRIFTARFFAVSLYSLLHRCRRRRDHHSSASDKLCFNHFVTPPAYTLSPPYNLYWQEIYRNLVPIIGNPASFSRFLAANSWAGPLAYRPDLRHLYRFSYLSRFLSWLLSGYLGDQLETFLKKIQLRRIRTNVIHDIGESPRLLYNDYELEFHPDMHKFINILRSMKK